MIHLTENIYHELDNEYSGLCLKCFSIAHGDTEPDARNYFCECCECKKVYGIQELVMMGLIVMDEENQDFKPYVKLKNKKTGLETTKEISF